MTEIITIKFKNHGKSYYFSPNGLSIKTGDKVIVETAKGLEIAQVWYGCHMIDDNAVVQPLRNVVRIATKDDLRVEQINHKREKEAYDICKKKIAQHGLDMKLVNVECSFEGNKTTFFFTSDGRVDFRELVKDLAGIFRNRIELRQIGVRDETKMLGGIGICGRPYCCNQFLDDFQPVSTKMAKVQSLSLNPTKISGACGRLMCCLRYEQEAYEDLVKKVPKQGAFVETKDGYGTAVQVNLLRQTVKVRLDDDRDDSLHVFKANELCAVPGGRPKDGEKPAHVLNYVPEEESEETEAPVDDWAIPTMVVDDKPKAESESVTVPVEREKRRRPNRRRKPSGENKGESKVEVKAVPKAEAAEQKAEGKPQGERKERRRGGRGRRGGEKRPAAEGNKVTVKPVKVEEKKAPAAPAKPKAEGSAEGGEQKRRPNRRRRYGKPKTQGSAPAKE